jgi:hypothetical protein
MFLKCLFFDNKQNVLNVNHHFDAGSREVYVEGQTGHQGWVERRTSSRSLLQPKTGTLRCRDFRSRVRSSLKVVKGLWL